MSDYNMDEPDADWITIDRATQSDEPSYIPVSGKKKPHNLGVLIAVGAVGVTALTLSTAILITKAKNEGRMIPEEAALRYLQGDDRNAFVVPADASDCTTIYRNETLDNRVVICPGKVPVFEMKTPEGWRPYNKN